VSYTDEIEAKRRKIHGDMAVDRFNKQMKNNDFWKKYKDFRNMVILRDTTRYSSLKLTKRY